MNLKEFLEKWEDKIPEKFRFNPSIEKEWFDDFSEALQVDGSLNLRATMVKDPRLVCIERFRLKGLSKVGTLGSVSICQ